MSVRMMFHCGWVYVRLNVLFWFPVGDSWKFIIRLYAPHIKAPIASH